MAYIATYKQLIDNVFKTIYFRTSAEAVGETSNLKFFRPNIYTVNGLKFFDDNTHKGVTLYGDNINLSSSDSTTISNKISSIASSLNSDYIKKDNVLSEGDISKNGYENSNILDVSALEYYLETYQSFASKAVATAGSNGLMSYTDKQNLDTLVKLLQEDSDSVINTIQEVLNAFKDAPESLDIVTALSKIPKTTVGSSAPSSPKNGDIWLDTSTS